MRSIYIILVALQLFAFRSNGLPTKEHFKIDWNEIKPKHLEFKGYTPKETFTLFSQDYLQMKMSEQNPIPEDYPFYKKGTKKFSDVCGQIGLGKTRIVGGTESPPHKYPWQAALFVDGKWFCGGTLISDEWILTAAHCADNASNMKIMLGAHNVREDEEDGRIEVEAETFFTHPDWSSFNLHNDLALVKIPKVNFSDIISPVCLPAHSEAGEKWAHELCWASGWGKPSDTATSISDVLRHVDVETIANIACLLEFPTVINKNIICISGANKKSTCNGDSGGPLHLPMENGRYKQIGITSFGSSLGCEIGMHAGFTRTASFLQWIETETGIMIDP